MPPVKGGYRIPAWGVTRIPARNPLWILVGILVGRGFRRGSGGGSRHGSSGAPGPAVPLAGTDRRGRHRLRRPEGLTALTMRRLGTELGVEAMSLYRYVAGRDDLLEGMVEQMVTQLHLGPDGGRPGPGDTWQAYLQLAGPRRPGARPRAPPGVPADRDAAPDRPVATTAAAQPEGGRGLPQHAGRARLQRRRRGRGLPRVLQLPARAPPAGGRDGRPPRPRPSPRPTRAARRA